MKQRLALALLASLVAAPVVAGPGVIAPGTDLWHTPGDGSTYIDFGTKPLPADFFCLGSEPFAGRIALQGAPLATAGARVGNADTVLERLDPARFDADGVATTRVRLTSLSLVSTDTIETNCGSYTVKAFLAGEQPVTTMTIRREHEGGGHFTTALMLTTKVVFVPAAGNSNRPVELVQSIRSRESQHPWAARPGRGGIVARAPFDTDTDGDGRPDRRVAGSSAGFAPGWTSFIDAKTGERQLRVLEPAVPSFLPSDDFGGESHAVTPPTDDEG